MKNLPRPIYTQQIPAGPVFDLIFVEGGGFEMGGTRHDDEQPVHWCEVPSLYLGKYPVTQVLWEAVMQSSFQVCRPGPPGRTGQLLRRGGVLQCAERTLRV